MTRRAPAPYANPYSCGILLGIVLLASFLISGRGLGVSGAFDRLAASILAPTPDSSLAGDWLLWEVGGLILGAGASGLLGGRARFTVDRGPSIGARTRLLLAGAGGLLVGFGSRLAHGCTSGQALSGGALLSAGSWAFMLTLFASAYGLAGVLRKIWR